MQYNTTQYNTEHKRQGKALPGSVAGAWTQPYPVAFRSRCSHTLSCCMLTNPKTGNTLDTTTAFGMI